MVTTYSDLEDHTAWICVHVSGNMVNCQLANKRPLAPQACQHLQYSMSHTNRTTVKGHGCDVPSQACMGDYSPWNNTAVSILSVILVTGLITVKYILHCVSVCLVSRPEATVQVWGC